MYMDNFFGKVLIVFFILIILLAVSSSALAEQPIIWVPLKDIPDVGAVEWGLASFVKRALEEAQRRDAQAVIFEIDTFGGRVDAMLFIKDLIFKAPIKTVAFVNSKAWSAGVFIALSCEKIFITPDGSIGASEPRSGQEDVEKPDPKTVSAIRAQIEALAQARERDPTIFAAMVDRNVEIEGLKEKGALLTLPAYLALQHKAVDGIARTQKEVLEQLGFDGPLISLTPSWSELLARFLTHPAIVPLLLLLAFGGIFLEIMTPGFGIPGAVGITATALFFGGRYVAGLSGWEPLILFIAGITLLAIEILVIPGFGIVGVSGIVALVMSLYLVLRTTRILFRGTVILEMLLYLAIMGVIFLVGLFFLPKNPIWSRLGLQEKVSPPEKNQETSPYRALLGQVGTAKTILRPAGVIEIDGKSYDAISRGEFIRAGEKVVVDEVRGNKIIVIRKKED
ncbi:NfeD family protein [Atrimonas thermophila]|jgi:membrane-bound serine protease (ClpP class)